MWQILDRDCTIFHELRATPFLLAFLKLMSDLFYRNTCIYIP